MIEIGNAKMNDIDWSITCEKCLGEMVKRRINLGNGSKKMVMQCKRCRFFKELDEEEKFF